MSAPTSPFTIPVDPTSIGTLEYNMPALAGSEAEIIFRNAGYDQLAKAERTWWDALMAFQTKVDGTISVPHPDGGYTNSDVPGASRHEALRDFHDALKARTNDISHPMNKRAPFWNAQRTIEGHELFALSDGTKSADPRIIDELVQQYMTHIPVETEALVRASENKYAHAVRLRELQLEHLRTIPSVAHLPTGYTPEMAESLIQRTIATRETALGQMQKELGYIRDNITKILGFKTAQAAETTGGLPVDPPIPPVATTPPSRGGGGYSGGYSYGSTERAAQTANRSESWVARLEGKWGMAIVATVALGALAYGMTLKSKNAAEKKPDSQHSR